MRAIGLHEDVIVVESRVWRTTATVVRSGDEAFLIDSPVFPDELELLPSLLEQAQLPVCAACSRRTATGTTCSGGSRSPGARSASPRRRRRGCARDPGARSARCATSTSATTSSARRRSRSARSRRCRCPATAGSASAELELHPADGHTVDGMAVWMPLGRRARLRRLPLAGRDPDARGRVDAYLATLDAARAARRARRPTSSPATAARSTRRARRRCSPRTARTLRRCARGRGRRRCRRAGATPSSAGCTPPTSRGCVSRPRVRTTGPIRVRRRRAGP